jgi:hypothetical protein
MEIPSESIFTCNIDNISETQVVDAVESIKYPLYSTNYLVDLFVIDILEEIKKISKDSDIGLLDILQGDLISEPSLYVLTIS